MPNDILFAHPDWSLMPQTPKGCECGWSNGQGLVVGLRHIGFDKALRDRMADVDRIAVRIRLLPLLGGHLDVRFLEFDLPKVALYRDASGRATWDFSDGAKRGQPLRLPRRRD